MGRFNLANYTEVKDRIPLFLAQYPEGRIVTTIVHMDFEATPAVCVVRAELYRDHDATEPMATGLAYEREAGPVNKTSFVENCETSAIGRAFVATPTLQATTRSHRDRRWRKSSASKLRLRS